MALYSINDVINDINGEYERELLIPSGMLADIFRNWNDMMFTQVIIYLIKNDKMDILYELLCDMCHYNKINFLKIIIKYTSKNNMKITYYDTSYMYLIVDKWTTDLTMLKYLYNLNMMDANIEIQDGLTRDDYQLVFSVNDKIFI
jgi:hypothetical protein